MTFYNIVQSLFNRHHWIEGATESLIEQCIPAHFQLAWKTQKDWMEGKQVLLFYCTSTVVRDAIMSSISENAHLSSVKFCLKPVGSKTCTDLLGQIVDSNFFSDAHLVFNLNWNELERIKL
jgi:hypothetical protein